MATPFDLITREGITKFASNFIHTSYRLNTPQQTLIIPEVSLLKKCKNVVLNMFSR